MRHTKIILIIAGFASLAAPFSRAATIAQSGTYAFVPNGSQILSFLKFDTNLGTLNSVSVTFTLTKTGGSLAVDNDSNESGTADFSHNINAVVEPDQGVTNLLDSSLHQFSLIVNTGTSQLIGPTSGDPTDKFDETGQSDYFLFAAPIASGTRAGQIHSSILFQYQASGSESFTLSATATQDISADGVGGIKQLIFPSNVDGEVTVTYDYSVIPEPAALWLLGVGLACLGVLRRRRA